MRIEVQKATYADIEGLFDIRCRSNGASKYTADGEILLAGIDNLMSRPEYGYYAVAKTVDDIEPEVTQVCGSVTVLKQWSPLEAREVHFLSCVYVDPAFRR
jgi:hypothetical protein